MRNTVISWLVLSVLLFWSMGAYNRLVKLRALALVAFTALDGLLVQCSQFIRQHGVNPLETPGSDASQWLMRSLAIEQFDLSLKIARTKPLSKPEMGTLKANLETMLLAAASMPYTLQPQWTQLVLQAELSQQEFNHRVIHYNDAIYQFPAIMLAKVFGFKSAQPI
jgi:LemA protein